MPGRLSSLLFLNLPAAIQITREHGQVAIPLAHCLIHTVEGDNVSRAGLACVGDGGTTWARAKSPCKQGSHEDQQANYSDGNWS